MPRSKAAFVCSSCGATEPRWTGRCPQCRAWNTFARAPRGWQDDSPARHQAPAVPAASLDSVSTEACPRIRLPLPELDMVLGGGVVVGSMVLLGGEPGIGKSTLMLQLCGVLAQAAGTVLYVSGEESSRQVRLRADRLGISAPGLLVLCETDLDSILAESDRVAPAVLVIDSIQTVRADDIDGSAGSVSQVRECAARLLRLAKQAGVAVFVVGHVTKSGDIAGPKVLEHMVDAVLYLEGERFHTYRLLRCVKNRFGATNEVGVFEMRQGGLTAVENPSAMFLAERLEGVPGSAVTVAVEGSRPLLVEVQALVGAPGAPVPRRTANGMDYNRLLLLVAVLEARVRLPLCNRDIFANVVGGLRVTEPALDLAVAAAIASSARGVAMPRDMVVFGEVGLSGELRSVAGTERRLVEAAKLGYRQAVVPAAALAGTAMPGAMVARGARTLAEALRLGLAPGAGHADRSDVGKAPSPGD